LKDALELLEFDKVKQLYAKYCFSEGGRKWIAGLYPKSHPWDELCLVEEMIKTLRAFEPPISYDFNVADLFHKASMGSVLEPHEFLRIQSFLSGCQAMKDFGRKLDASRLKSVFMSLKELPGVIHEIRKAISEDGEVKDNASKKLMEIRGRKKEVSRELKRLSERVKEKYRQFLQDEMVIVRDGRYMLAVKSSHRPKVRGIVHHSSARQRNDALYRA